MGRLRKPRHAEPARKVPQRNDLGCAFPEPPLPCGPRESGRSDRRSRARLRAPARGLLRSAGRREADPAVFGIVEVAADADAVPVVAEMSALRRQPPPLGGKEPAEGAPLPAAPRKDDPAAAAGA